MIRLGWLNPFIISSDDIREYGINGAFVASLIFSSPTYHDLINEYVSEWNLDWIYEQLFFLSKEEIISEINNLDGKYNLKIFIKGKKLIIIQLGEEGGSDE